MYPFKSYWKARKQNQKFERYAVLHQFILYEFRLLPSSLLSPECETTPFCFIMVHYERYGCDWLKNEMKIHLLIFFSFLQLVEDPYAKFEALDELAVSTKVNKFSLLHNTLILLLSFLLSLYIFIIIYYIFLLLRIDVISWHFADHSGSQPVIFSGVASPFFYFFKFISSTVCNI